MRRNFLFLTLVLTLFPIVSFSTDAENTKTPIVNAELRKLYFYERTLKVFGPRSEYDASILAESSIFSSTTTRYRKLVSGCKAGQGKLANQSATSDELLHVAAWIKEGDKEEDLVARELCKRWQAQQTAPSVDRRTPAKTGTDRVFIGETDNASRWFVFASSIKTSTGVMEVQGRAVVEWTDGKSQQYLISVNGCSTGRGTFVMADPSGPDLSTDAWRAGDNTPRSRMALMLCSKKGKSA